MKRLCIYFLLLQLSIQARPMTAEDYYAVAFDKMSEMLAGKSTLSIKRAAFLAEWAYYEGHLDYQINDEFIEHMKQRSIEVRKYIQENLMPK